MTQSVTADKGDSVLEAKRSRTPVLPNAATVTAVKHWSDQLFSFNVERPDSLRFRSGEFVMLGLMGSPESGTGKAWPLLRAYSIASPSWAEELEFYSIKVPDGPLTSRLQNLKPGDDIILRPKPVGTLVLDALLPGERLWLMATGTGVAPFASLIRDPETYERFNQVILMHTCRTNSELQYSRLLVEEMIKDDIVSEMIDSKFTYYPSTTREESENNGRITDALLSKEFYQKISETQLDHSRDRCMICGSLAFNQDVITILENLEFTEGSNSKPSSYVVEKAFVD